MKSLGLRVLTVLATAGLLFTAAPAHASQTAPDPSAPITVKPGPIDWIPHPRPPRISPCPVFPGPPDWMVPLYCEIIPTPRPPRDGIDPIPGPKLPIKLELRADPKP